MSRWLANRSAVQHGPQPGITPEALCHTQPCVFLFFGRFDSYGCTLLLPLTVTLLPREVGRRNTMHSLFKTVGQRLRTSSQSAESGLWSVGLALICVLFLCRFFADSLWQSEYILQLLTVNLSVWFVFALFPRNSTIFPQGVHLKSKSDSNCEGVG